MKPRLSALFVAVSAASLLAMSTVSFAAHKYHHHKVVAVADHDEHDDFKGEANYKAEVPPPCPPVMLLHDGFYVGAGVGYDSYRIHRNFESTEVILPTNVLVSSASLSDARSATGWMGGIFAGYGRYFNWFYLGAEINANVSNAEGSRTYSASDGTSFHDTVKARTSYGIGLLPGIKVNDSSLLYARVGYLRTDFRATETGTDNVDAGGAVNFSNSNSHWRNGINYGVGLETYVAENVSVRGEFTHTTYTNKTTTATFIDPLTGVNQFTFTSKVRPSNNEFMLSLLYHFC